MASIKATGCCGMKEIDNISLDLRPEDVLYSSGVKYELGRKSRYHLPFMIFSGVTNRVVGDHASNRKDNYAQALADFILTNNFGTLLKTEEKVNPRTGNSLCVWLWTVNYPILWAWYDKQEEQERVKFEEARALFAKQNANIHTISTTYHISSYGTSTSNS